MHAICNVIVHYFGTANNDEIKFHHNSSNNSNQSNHVENLCTARSRLNRIKIYISITNHLASVGAYCSFN